MARREVAHSPRGDDGRGGRWKYYRQQVAQWQAPVGKWARWRSCATLQVSLKQRQSKYKKLFPHLEPGAKSGGEGVNVSALLPLVAIVLLFGFWLYTMFNAGARPTSMSMTRTAVGQGVLTAPVGLVAAPVGATPTPGQQSLVAVAEAQLATPTRRPSMTPVASATAGATTADELPGTATATASATITPTWTPSLTSTATATPLPDSFTGVVIGCAQLNERYGPGLAWPVRAVLDDGQAVTIVGRDESGVWGTDGLGSWLHLHYVSRPSGFDVGGLPVVAYPPPSEFLR